MFCQVRVLRRCLDLMPARLLCGTLCLLCMTFVPAASAESAYVSDQLVITVRNAPQRTADILTHLRSGDRVEILARPSDSDFVKVRAPGGVEGWSLSQYLMQSPAASDQLDAVRSEREALATNLSRVTEQAAALKTKLDTTEAELRRVSEQASAQAQELDEIRATSAGALELSTRHEALSQRVATAEADRESLARENQNLRSGRQRDWMLAGAGILGGGMLLGWVLARQIRRKRWEW